MTSHHRSSPRPSSMGRRQSKHWDEADVYSGWRRVLAYLQKAGATAFVKRRTRRRERHEARADLRQVVAIVQRRIGDGPWVALDPPVYEGDTSWSPHDPEVQR